MKFKQYLSNLKLLLQKSNHKRFVIGNSSADFDSIFGSLIYAFFLTTQIGKTYLPIIDCNKSDIALRFDVNYMMKRFKIDSHQLLYSSDINFYDQQNSFCLYDHNQRQSITIEQLVDHHAFQKAPNSPEQHNRILYPAGSALTLLYFLLHPHALSYQQKSFQNAFQPYIEHHKISTEKQCEVQSDVLIDEIIRHGVLIDSFGFDERQKERWTEADVYAVREIQKRHKFDLTYENLSDLKFDQTMNLELTLEEHLRRDYKKYMYNAIGQVEYSIVTLDPEIFLKYYGQKLIQKFSYSQYQTYMIMFIWIKEQKTQTKPEVFGRAAIFSISPDTNVQQKVEIRQSIERVMKKVKLVQEKGFDNWFRWSDPSATVSRKLIDKEFRQFFNEKKQAQL